MNLSSLRIWAILQISPHDWWPSHNWYLVWQWKVSIWLTFRQTDQYSTYNTSWICPDPVVAGVPVYGILLTPDVSGILDGPNYCDVFVASSESSLASTCPQIYSFCHEYYAGYVHFVFPQYQTSWNVTKTTDIGHTQLYQFPCSHLVIICGIIVFPGYQKDGRIRCAWKNRMLVKRVIRFK